MKILLIQPPKPEITCGTEDFSLFPPLALEYLAAGIKENHEVKILDLRLENNFEQTLALFDPDIIGITAYSVHVNTVKKLFERIKRWNPDILTLVGGHHATIQYEDFHSPDIDLIVVGEGVFVFREIVERFAENKSIVGIPGTAVKEGNGLKYFKNDADYHLDDFPFPARELTRKYRDYYNSDWMKPLVSIRTSKGCPFRCKFCALWKIAGKQYYKRDPEQIARELETIEEKYIFFADDESLVDVKRMKKLADIIRERGIDKRYFLYGRSDTIANNPDLLKAWKNIGLERIFVGLEFFNDSDLDYISKNSSVKDNLKAIKILQDLDIKIHASLLVRPNFSKEDFKQLREFVRKTKLDYVGYSILTPLPGTDLMEEVKKNLLTENYEMFDFLHTVMPTSLPLKEFYKEYLNLYKKSVPFWRGVKMMANYKFPDAVALLGKVSNFYKRIERLHLDHNIAG